MEEKLSLNKKSYTPSLWKTDDKILPPRYKTKNSNNKYALTEEEEGELDEKKFKTSPGAASILKKHDGSCKKAVDAGDFDWASEPYAVCNAAKIVTQGHPTVPKGSKFTKGKGPDGKGRKLIEK